MNNKYIAIMAGGVGSRFWPSSTESCPKQFLDILGVGRSLIQMTYDRVVRIVPNENILIVTNQRYKNLVQEHLPDLPEHNILCEPSRNNAAPCVAYTALNIEARNPDAVFAILPSDHVILKEQSYLDNLEAAFTYAAKNPAIVTLGIQPTRPDTGYGYIETESKSQGNVLKVVSFREKPDLQTAQSYVTKGNYLWNAGMFIWSVKTILSSFEKNAQKIIDVLSSDKSKYGTSEEQQYINKVYPLTESISVDYAILEKATNVYTIPVDIGWSDLGTWNSLHSFKEKDDNNCVTIGGNMTLIETKNCIVSTSPQKKIVIKGLENFIVVEVKDALLIYPKDDEQEIKSVVKKINA